LPPTRQGGFLAKVIGPKRQWREYKARGRQLPTSYRTALDALEPYLNYYGGTGATGLRFTGRASDDVAATRALA
jgi:DNA-binding ferritin-like protein (Dps family)